MIRRARLQSCRWPAAAFAWLLAGCAAAVPPGAQRPSISLADQVGAVDGALLTGIWQCHELNPYPGVAASTSRVTFRVDGGVTGGDASGAELGRLNFRSSGRWQLEGDQLVLLASPTAPETGNPVLSAIGSLGSLFEDPATRDRPLRNDILQLGPDQLVWRAVGFPDPAVVACTR